MSESVLKKFGKYFLLDRIGEGGMAEIFRARMARLDASGRLIVIKRIQSAFNNNAEFLQMFRSEVQITMRFTHPNIVQLHEAGEENGQQFIAMELVDGRNLRQLLSKISQKQKRIPVSASCFIVEQTAAGLHYAHTFKDRISGEALNLVHRDVSPQNILVSYDGNIKVIDFGIAKATTSGEVTRAGVIKGKLSYLSPEQVMGDPLDSRSDVFALGIVLWELLTGRRLFVAEGDNEFQVLKMIESCNTFVKPPSVFNPEVPPELDVIVMQALQRDLNKRFQSAEEVTRALRKLLAVQYSDFGPSDLAYFVKKLFHEQIVEDRKQLQNLNAQAEELITLGNVVVPTPQDLAMQPLESLDQNNKDQTRVKNLGVLFDKSQITAADRLELARQPKLQMKVPARHDSKSAMKTIPKDKARGKERIDLKPIPSATLHSSKGGGGFSKAFLFLAIALGGGYYFRDQLLPTRGTELTTTVSSNPQKNSAQQNGKSVQFKLHLIPEGDLSQTKVSVNSIPFDLNTGSQIGIGEPVALVVERPGFERYFKEFAIPELNNSSEYLWEVKLTPMDYGTFTLTAAAGTAKVTIISLDQETKGMLQNTMVLATPIDREKLPPGRYKVIVRSDLLNMERELPIIEIKAGSNIVENDITLEPVSAREPANRRFLPARRPARR